MGCADRSAYDLSVHSKITGENLSAREALHTPIIEERLEIAGLMPKLGKNFGGKTKFIVQSLDNLNNKSDESQKMLGYLQTTLESQGLELLLFFMLIRLNPIRCSINRLSYTLFLQDTLKLLEQTQRTIPSIKT